MISPMIFTRTRINPLTPLDARRAGNDVTLGEFLRHISVGGPEAAGAATVVQRHIVYSHHRSQLSVRVQPVPAELVPLLAKGAPAAVWVWSQRSRADAEAQGPGTAATTAVATTMTTAARPMQPLAMSYSFGAFLEAAFYNRSMPDVHCFGCGNQVAVFERKPTTVFECVLPAIKQLPADRARMSEQFHDQVSHALVRS
jgi:hypothetical protein